MKELPSSHNVDPEGRWISNYPWHEFSYANKTNFADHFQMYRDIVEWIKANIETYEHSTMWTKIGDAIYVKIKNDKDAVMFTLKFGPGDYNGSV